MPKSKPTNSFLITISAPLCFKHSYGHNRGIHNGVPPHFDGEGLRDCEIEFFINYFTKQLKHCSKMLIIQENKNSKKQLFKHLHIYLCYLHPRIGDNVRKTLINLKDNPMIYYCANQYKIQSIYKDPENTLRYICKDVDDDKNIKLLKKITRKDICIYKNEYAKHLKEKNKQVSSANTKCLSKFFLHERIKEYIDKNTIPYDFTSDSFIKIIKMMISSGYNLFNLRGNAKWAHALLNQSYGHSSNLTFLLEQEFSREF